jgi:ribosomal protein L37AE/L43A
MSITNQDRKQGEKLHERCRAFAIALKVIDESMLPADQKEDLIGQMFKPMLAANVEVELSDIRQALSRGSDLQSVGTVVKPTRSPEIQWVIDQRQQQKPKASAAQMTKLISEEQAAVARKAYIWGVLSHFGLEYTPPVQRTWPGESMRWTSITRCPVCGHELWIDNTYQCWMCKTCRSGGDVIDLVRHLTACTAQRAIAWLSGDAPMPAHRSKSARQHASAKTRRLEDIAQRYDLALTETTETPAMTHIEAGWPPRVWGGKTFITTCPTCKGPLFIYVNVDRQLWTCRTCNRGYSSREGGKDGDAIEFVRFLSGCSFNRAVWYLADCGTQPKRETVGGQRHSATKLCL